MSRSLDLSPFLVFIVMIAGATIGWILGIILAVPIAAIARVIYMNYKKKHQ
jgi:predicted PurR-regulated permease PerM